MLHAKGIHKAYGSLPILKGVDIAVEKGEIVSIVGASGAGKSTLLHIIGTLDKPDQGAVFINGVDVQKLNAKKLSAFRNEHIGFVFQFHHLLPEFTALENVCIPAFIQGKGRSEAEAKARLFWQMNLRVILTQRMQQLCISCFLILDINFSRHLLSLPIMRNLPEFRTEQYICAMG